MSNKINYVEITGNLAADARVTAKATFITVATWNGKDKEGNDRPTSFIDVSLFGNINTKDLLKVKRITLKGRLANYKDKETNYNKIGVVGISFKVLEKEQNKDLKVVSFKNESKDLTNDVPWELDAL